MPIQNNNPFSITTEIAEEDNSTLLQYGFETDYEYANRISSLEPIEIGECVVDNDSVVNGTRYYPICIYIAFKVEKIHNVIDVQPDGICLNPSQPTLSTADNLVENLLLPKNKKINSVTYKMYARLKVHRSKVYIDYSSVFIIYNKSRNAVTVLSGKKYPYENDKEYFYRIRNYENIPLGIAVPCGFEYDINNQILPFKIYYNSLCSKLLNINTVTTIPCVVKKDRAQNICLTRNRYFVFGSLACHLGIEKYS